MTKKFAISIPIGAWHPLLLHCLQSLRCQSEFVEIAVLDASNDQRVSTLLDEFDDMFTYRRTGPDKGQSDAIIEGWNETKAPILGWLNADDALYPNTLKIISEKFESNSSIDVAYGDSTIIDDDLYYRGYHWAVAPPSDRILSECIISQPSCFFKRAAVDAIGGLDKELHYTMDWDLWVRLWRSGAKFSFVETPLSRVLWSRDAKTGGFNAARRKELERIISQNSDFIQKIKSRMGFALHHVFEYLAPKALASKFRQLNVANARDLYGFNRSGYIHQNAYLPIVCYGKEPAQSIELMVENGADHITVVLGNQEKQMAKDKMQLSLDDTSNIGAILEIGLRNLSTSQTQFVSARWL